MINEELLDALYRHVPAAKCKYAVRPMVCRLWGVVASMKCPFGCMPEATLSNAMSALLLRQSWTFGGFPLVSMGPQSEMHQLLERVL